MLTGSRSGNTSLVQSVILLFKRRVVTQACNVLTFLSTIGLARLINPAI
jgi:hypothetical protein